MDTTAVSSSLSGLTSSTYPFQYIYVLNEGKEIGDRGLGR